MRSVRVVLALSVLVACHQPAAEHGRLEGRHTCDPKGPERVPVQPKFFEYSATELDQSEQALLTDKRCHLEIAAPGKAMTEDEVILSSCGDLSESYASAKRSACRHACLVDAREAAAGETYRRVIEGLDALARVMESHGKTLDACAGRYGSAGTGPTARTDAADGRNYWACVGNAPLPPSFTVIVEHEHGVQPRLSSVVIEGTMPGLPPHTWKLSLQDYGCDLEHWATAQLAPWPVP